jgi:phosphate transport system substrate-binding protein
MTVGRPRRTLLALLAALCCGCLGCFRAVDDVTVQGSGATFPAPLYKRWFLEYYQAHPEVRVNYTPIGSGAGIRQFTAGLVTFGASDAGMSPKEIEKLPPEFGGVRLLPMTAGSIVLSYNLPGAPKGLRLSRKAYLGIFLREITAWNDPEIAEANLGVALPDLPITVVTRADSSGTTYAFTNHLSAVGNAIGMEWTPGVDKSVRWKESIAAQGNDGVAALVQLTPGAVGYLEFAYAELAGLPMAALENRAGRYVLPGRDAGRYALEGAPIPADLQIKVPDPTAEEAYPIVTYTWLLCRGRYQGAKDAQAAEALKKVIAYCLEDGQKISTDLGYLPLPDEVVRRVREAVGQIEVSP